MVLEEADTKGRESSRE